MPDDPRRETVAGEGWHPDPFDLAEERWWDGRQWTEHVRGARVEGVQARAQSDATAVEGLLGMPPGWYLWRGEVARWWDGEKWGSSRRPFADHLGPSGAPPKSRARAGLGYASVLVLVVSGAILWITLTPGSSHVGYRTRVGGLCRQSFARERTDILKQSTAAVSAVRSRSQAVFLGRLLRALLHDSALFDHRLEAITPPANLRPTRERYLGLERQDSAIYNRVIPGLEGRSGFRALTPVTGVISRNAEELQRLLDRLGGRPCSNNPLG